MMWPFTVVASYESELSHLSATQISERVVNASLEYYEDHRREFAEDMRASDIVYDVEDFLRAVEKNDGRVAIECLYKECCENEWKFDVSKLLREVYGSDTDAYWPNRNTATNAESVLR
ncbi:hypothetical protein [Methylobacterium durans]|uniref:Uncharacterized protein n=1 Tax=Methylobacterium durans TaxID=2202825 RepID=A0A2U8W4X4_9HYPH|nr:hypothetical protein [Methylobacterium durans]AWN41163.1 hypothetical protein DK389_12300 [Methylobacterium durans]